MRRSLSCLLATLAALVLAAVASRYVLVLPYLSPFHSGQIQMALMATVLAIVSFLMRRNWISALLVVAGLIFTAHLPVRVRAFADMATPAEAAGRPGLKLMSFNILNDNFENGPRIADVIRESGADVAVILEADPLRPLLPDLSRTYPYRVGCSTEAGRCDLTILSRHPFIDQEIGNLSDLRSERYMRVAIEVAGQRINVAAAHLSKPYFDDYHTVELRRLRNRLAKIEGPLVLAGDFNASSIAPDMMWFLRQSGLKKAPWEPATWPIPLGPAGIAIDHIYARAPLRLAGIERLADDYGSNHYGLVADLILAEEAPRPQ